jgi:hypothetical protein
MLANMSYRYINLARNYGLLDDEHIEKWAYGHMERDSEPEWWFSELISACSGTLNLATELEVILSSSLTR